jgi:N-acetylglucosaminyldiphosphoundecaprenol N-acetyl-beta-D-mannosaminyltransferase
MLQQNAGLREAYQQASLILADGWPVVAASRLLRKRLPERVAGSDVVPNLFASMDGVSPLRVYLLGAAPGVGVRAAANIQQRFPGVKVVGVDSPPIGFERHADENETSLARIADAQPDLLVVGLGAPKQELWVHAHRHAIRAKVAICAGATIDFLAGEKRRAPKWLRCLGLEWLHRLCSEPKRLGRRYLKDGVVFPLIVWREMQASR